MGATGRVRDRVERAAAQRRWGSRFCGRALALEQNGGAPSSLTRPQSLHHARTSRERALPLSLISQPPDKPFSYKPSTCEMVSQEGTNGQRKE